METYVVKEIREYEVSILMGLNKRQLLCSVLAILSAVGMYFGLRRVVLHPAGFRKVLCEFHLGGGADCAVVVEDDGP